MEKLHYIQKKLIDCVECQVCNLEKVNTKELGEAIDMIKDLSEAIYYSTITEAMEGDWEDPSYYRDMDKTKGRMYYDGKAPRGHGSHAGAALAGAGNGSHHERELPLHEIMRDPKEGRSPISRKMYMESKELHKDKTVVLQELEKYAQELTADMVEMIEEATPEEKQYLSNRIAALATKIK